MPFPQVLQNLAELREGEEVYDHYDPGQRHRIPMEALPEYPVLDEDGLERKVYTESGAFIKRTRPKFARGTPTAGVLVRLDTISQMFERDEEMYDAGEDEEGIRVSVYPQSYLPNLGHVKANGVVTMFGDVIKEINEEIMPEPEPELEEEGNLQGGRRIALSAISCQFYNQLSHRVAKKAGTQEVQRGDQTAAMARWYPGYNQAAERNGQRLFERCASKLPFARHFDLIEEAETEGDIPKDLRMENVYVLDMHGIDERKRGGKCVVRFICRLG